MPALPIPRLKRRWPLALALSLALPLSLKAQPVLQGRSGSWTVSTQVATTPQRAWILLSDYGGQASRSPDITAVRVLQRRGNSVVLEQTYQAAYTFGLPIRVRLRIEETPPLGFRYRLIQGDSLRMLEGSWTIQPLKGGVELRHRIKVEPLLPAPLRPLYDRHQEANLIQWMTRLKQRLEQPSA